MERRKEEAIGDVLLRYLRQSLLETPLNEHRLIQSWNEVAGRAAAQLTTDVSIHNQKLYVRVRSSALRTELMMKRSELVRQLNANNMALQILSVDGDAGMLTENPSI